jgi:hypothetical protein
MRLRSAIGTAFLAILLAAAGGAATFAQSGGYIVVDPRTGAFYQQRGAPPGGARQSYAPQPAPPRQARGNQGYYPGMLVQPAPAPQPGFSLRRLFGIEDEPRQAAVPQVPPRVRQDRPRPRPPAVVARPEKPKINPTTHVVVFGDALADLVAQGLDDGFSDTPDVAVVRKVRADGGLARGDPGEWPKQALDLINGGQKITLAVVMIGANDRQPIKDGDTSVEPLSERWKTLYRQRVGAVLRVFQERSIPVVWVGLPPMRNDGLSADLIAMNEIYRESVQRAGGAYADIWPGFVNEENRYTNTGPDVDGQPSRLRANDGVLFTKAGARKAAHFADTEIRRILEALKAGTTVATVPATPAAVPAEGLSVDQMIDASVGVLPEPSGTPPLQAKPVAGPVLPQTRPDVSPGGALASGRPRVDNDAAYTLQKALREGVPPPPRPGRADDFRWPRS